MKKCKWCNKYIRENDLCRETTEGFMHEGCIKLHGFEIISLSNIAQRLGKLGGEKTLSKYGKEKMTEWGKKGGRPRKRR